MFSFCQGSVISSVLSHHNQDLKRWTLKPSVHYSSQTARVYSSWTDQFYLESKRKIHPHSRREGMLTQTMRRGERERTSACGRQTDPQPFGSSFYMLFPLLGPAPCKQGQPGVLFVLPEVLTPVLGPSFVLFSPAFPFPVF